MLKKIWDWIVAQVVWAEVNMAGKSGKEKRDTVVKKLDDMIQLPPLLEPFDRPILSFLVDLAVERLNAVVGHDFGSANLDEKQEEAIAAALPISDDMAKVLDTANAIAGKGNS